MITLTWISNIPPAQHTQGRRRPRRASQSVVPTMKETTAASPRERITNPAPSVAASPLNVVAAAYELLPAPEPAVEAVVEVVVDVAAVLASEDVMALVIMALVVKLIVEAIVDVDVVIAAVELSVELCCVVLVSISSAETRIDVLFVGEAHQRMF